MSTTVANKELVSLDYEYKTKFGFPAKVVDITADKVVAAVDCWGDWEIVIFDIYGYCEARNCSLVRIS